MNDAGVRRDGPPDEAGLGGALGLIGEAFGALAPRGRRESVPKPRAQGIEAEGNAGWFNNLYATGTRSVMGIEALICGFPPTPARSVVKLGKSQKNFFTLAQLLSKKGYSTEFIYGGDSNFDNMKGFFLGNGFQKVIEEKDFDHPKFQGSWGVSDQDLFDIERLVNFTAGLLSS